MENVQYSPDPAYSDHHRWMEHHYYPHQHHSPSQEHESYSYYSTAPAMESIFSQSRSTHHQLQPLITTPWPSMLATHPSYTSQAPHPLPAPPSSEHIPTHQPSVVQSRSQMQASVPQSPTLDSEIAPPNPITTPRRTLTDNDRRKMCKYHEDHPTKKQTEIGEIFGVERSTVSKVLRQKDKYLQHVVEDDGSSSPVKRTRLKHPDIDRTLAKWVSNQMSKGVPLKDDHIREQAKLFWIASGSATDCPVEIDSPEWLFKFKQENNLLGVKRRKGSNRSPVSPVYDEIYSPEEISRGGSPPPAAFYATHDANGSMEGLGIRGTRIPFHSQSNNSLSSAFTDGAPQTTFSSNTSTGSPVISPDGIPSATSYFPHAIPYATPTTITPTSASPRQRQRQRSRSSTFHSQHRQHPSMADSYISPPQSADASSPRYPSSKPVSATNAGLFEAHHQNPYLTTALSSASAYPSAPVTAIHSAAASTSSTSTNMQPPSRNVPSTSTLISTGRPSTTSSNKRTTAPVSSLHAKSMPSLKAARTSTSSSSKSKPNLPTPTSPKPSSTSTTSSSSSSSHRKSRTSANASDPPSNSVTKPKPKSKAASTSSSRSKTALSNTAASSPTLTEARRGLEAAIAFLRAQHQQNNSHITGGAEGGNSEEDSVDVADIRRVLGRLGVDEGQRLPGGLSRIPEMEFGARMDVDVDVDVDLHGDVDVVVDVNDVDVDVEVEEEEMREGHRVGGATGGAHQEEEWMQVPGGGGGSGGGDGRGFAYG